MYKNIIFDIDGTLLDSKNAILTSLRDALYDETKHEYSLSELYFSFGITGEAALRQLKIKNIKGVGIRWLDYYKKHIADIKLFDGIEEVIKKLYSMNIYIGIVTSKYDIEFKNDFLRFDINKYFKLVICAEDTEKHKPDPDPILKFIEVAKIKKSETIYIGDAVYDMLCADRAGVDFALALWGAGEPEKIKAKYILKNPEDILKLV